MLNIAHFNDAFATPREQSKHLNEIESKAAHAIESVTKLQRLAEECLAVARYASALRSVLVKVHPVVLHDANANRMVREALAQEAIEFRKYETMDTDYASAVVRAENAEKELAALKVKVANLQADAQELYTLRRSLRNLTGDDYELDE